jgi:hypothetical protein
VNARSVLALLAAVLLLPACGDESTSGAPSAGPPPGSILLLNDANAIFRISPGSPSLTESVVVVTGLGGDTLAKIKHHPATGRLLGLSENGLFFLIDPVTGHAGRLFNTALGLAGTYSFDVHPATGILSVQTDADDRAFVDPTDGSATPAADLSPASSVVAAAYAPGGTLFAISMSATGDLVAVAADSSVAAVGPLPSISASADVDVAANGTAYAVLTPTAGGGGVTNLYTIDLATGAATLVGPLQPAALRSLTVVP